MKRRDRIRKKREVRDGSNWRKAIMRWRDSHCRVSFFSLFRLVEVCGVGCVEIRRV